MKAYNESCEVRNRRHYTFDHGPTKSTASSLATLMDNWANAVSFDYGPYEEGNASGGDEIRFDGEEMTDLMDREPDGWQ